MALHGTALITGASSGVGATYASRLAASGYDLILVGRHPDRLRTMAAALTTESRRTVETTAADLTDNEDVARVELVLRTDASITLLVNSARVVSSTPLPRADLGRAVELLALNVTAAARLAAAAARAFAARGSGTIVNVSSTGAIYPESSDGVFNASQAFVLALTRSMHCELAGRGVRVQAVLLGEPPLGARCAIGAPADLRAAAARSTRDLVDAALSGLAQGDLVTIPGLANKVDWDAFERARDALARSLRLSAARHDPASRKEGNTTFGIPSWPA